MKGIAANMNVTYSKVNDGNPSFKPSYNPRSSPKYRVIAAGTISNLINLWLLSLNFSRSL